MKTDWSMWSLTPDSTMDATINDLYATTTTDTVSTNDIYDAIRYASIRSMDMKENKTRGVGFDELEKVLRKMGIFLTEIRQDSYNDYAEITCRVNPIDWYMSLDKKDTNKRRDVFTEAAKNGRPHPKKVIFRGPATTILWTDGSKTTVKCSDEDVWEDEVGIAMCYLKKMLGNKGNYNNIFREAMKVAEVQTPRASTISDIDSGVCISNAFDNMSNTIEKIRKCMTDAANELSKIEKEKK